MTSDTDTELRGLLDQLWRMPPHGVSNIHGVSEFKALRDLLERRHGRGKADFALSNILRALAMPGLTPAGQPASARDPEALAVQIDAAMLAETATRRHLCPLELADDLPEMAFGPARIGRYDTRQLESLFDRGRLERFFPGRMPDFGRLSQLQWLTVEEEVEVDPRPEARAIPILFTRMDQDFGAFDPLARRYPAVVEQTLFCLLLLPWEDWSTMLEVNWRGFTLPWIYTVDGDLAIRPAVPPDTQDLAFEEFSYPDDWGDEVEHERPVVLRLEEAAADDMAAKTAATWRDLDAAAASDLFRTPVEHFAVRAFATGGIDELMAHMTVLEAALGEEADHNKALRPRPERGLGATERMARKVAGLLDDQAAGEAYRALFAIRSLFVHGRVGLATISTAQKVMARRLARQVLCRLLEVAASGPPPRSDLLADLLARGAPKET